MPGGQRSGGEGVSTQSAASVRPDLLRAGEGYRPVGGCTGAQQYQHDADLYDGIGSYAPEATGEDAVGDMKKPRNCCSVVRAANT